MQAATAKAFLRNYWVELLLIGLVAVWASILVILVLPAPGPESQTTPPLMLKC